MTENQYRAIVHNQKVILNEIHFLFKELDKIKLMVSEL